MSSVRFPVVTAVCLLLAAAVVTACGSQPSEESPDAPTPSSTSTPEPTATPEPTPTPLSTADVLSQSQAALADVRSMRFSFVRAGEGSLLEGSGQWQAPDRYSVETQVELCPPPVPGGPEVTDCDLVPWYRVVRIGEQVFSTPDHPSIKDVTWDVGSSSPLALGLLERGGSPAMAILDEILVLDTGSVGEQYSSSGELVALRLTANGASVAYILDLHVETLEPFHGVITGQNGREWTWTFTDHDSPVIIEAPGAGE